VAVNSAQAGTPALLSAFPPSVTILRPDLYSDSDPDPLELDREFALPRR
jgi:hypothetical protein